MIHIHSHFVVQNSFVMGILSMHIVHAGSNTTSNVLSVIFCIPVFCEPFVAFS